uniref:Uncharacterized protein n=1 Tax=Fagus sylvatica TaxID=28930 RepID=A0A2N9J8Q5_FAGSY
MPIRVLQPGEELSIDTAQQPEWVSDPSISLGDAVSEGAVVNGEHLNIFDPDWLDDGLEGPDFIDDIFIESVNVNESTPVNDYVYVDEHTTPTRPLVNVNANFIMPIAYVGAEDECVEKPVDDELNSVYDFDDDARQHYKDFNVQIDMQKTYRAKRKAREMLDGDERLEYAKLREYAEMIRSTNKGSHVILETKILDKGDERPIFNRMYIKYHVQKLFKEDIGDPEELKLGLELRVALWKCACASTKREFERNMEYLKCLDEKAWGYLEAIPKQQWTKTHFTKRALSDCLVNNLTRSQPIVRAQWFSSSSPTNYEPRETWSSMPSSSSQPVGRGSGIAGTDYRGSRRFVGVGTTRTDGVGVVGGVGVTSNGASRIDSVAGRVDAVSGVGRGVGRPPKKVANGGKGKKSSAIGHDVQQLVIVMLTYVSL